MLALFAALALALGEDPCPTPTPLEEDPIPGIPQGEDPALPEQVSWDLSKSVIDSNRLRSRFHLDSWWRFSASKTKEEIVERAHMGFAHLPGLVESSLEICDGQFQNTEGKWKGEPLDAYSWLVFERHLSAPSKWLHNKVILVAEGVWKDAEVFSFGVPIEGAARGDQMWFDLTEDLVYGGTTWLIIRRPRLPADEAKSLADTSSLRLELLPIGARVERMHITRDDAAKELEIELLLGRPPFLFTDGVGRIEKIPLAADVKLVDASDPDHPLGITYHVLGTMPEVSRTVRLRIPWNKAGTETAPENASLQIRIRPVQPGLFDITLPFAFKPAELMPTVAHTEGEPPIPATEDPEADKKEPTPGQEKPVTGSGD